jgi:hypothetical protein
MLGQPHIALAALLAVAAASLSISDHIRQQAAVQSAVSLCAQRRFNASNSELLKQATALRHAVDSAKKTLELRKWEWPDYSARINTLYVCSYVLDVAVLVTEQFSHRAEFDGSTSIYTVLNTDEACRRNFTRAMAEASSENTVPVKSQYFAAAATCIQKDMDKCVFSAYVSDLLTSTFSFLQSLVDTTLSHLEFRHNLQETKAGVETSEQKLTLQFSTLQNLLCDTQPGATACFMEATCVTYKCQTTGWIKKVETDRTSSPDEETCCEDSCAQKVDKSFCTTEDGSSGKCEEKICRGQQKANIGNPGWATQAFTSPTMTSPKIDT